MAIVNFPLRGKKMPEHTLLGCVLHDPERDTCCQVKRIIEPIGDLAWICKASENGHE
jgi:hypothetical protein